ncbi:MotE family protein [Tropicimonas sp. IMCC34043]|uniref:MotE family protein n=1 Tax=Tropicimonas sp. IMCC34043 TaxID=2248760 RepID=UPI000E23BE69|nr:hypothetical protein [Tropicimonas sp. IMCC34043]
MAGPAASRGRVGRRPGRGALGLIAALFLASGALRIVDGTGGALARGFEAIASSTQILDASSGALASCNEDPEVRAVLKSLRQRSQELDAREAQIAQRAQSLSLAEDEIQYNLAALIEAEASLKDTIALADGAAETDIARLTEVYERMKSKEAAALFETMDPVFAAGFLGRMKPEVSAAIMAGLSPQAAYTVSIVLAGRNTSVPTE